MKALVGAFNHEKALVGAFSVIVKPIDGLFAARVSTRGTLSYAALTSHQTLR